MTTPTENNSKNIRVKALLPIVVAFILALGLIIFFTATFFYNQQSQKDQDTAQRVEQHFEKQVQQSILDLSGALRLTGRDPSLVSAWQNKDRKSLSLNVQPLYKDLNTAFGITHFYFHTPSGKNFLRAHRPGRFGDTINRKTLLAARRTGELSAGLELGTFGQFVLRVVQPWTINGKIVGYLELGREIDYISQELKQITGTEIITLIDKNLINKEDWNQPLKSPFNWKRMDKWVIGSSTLDPIPSDFKLQPIQHTLTQHSNSEIKHYNTSHFPLSDFSKNNVGHVVVVHDITNSERQLSALLTNVLVTGLLIITLISIAYFIYLGRIEKQLTKTNLLLYKKIGEHKKTESELNLKHKELTAINRELESYSYSIAHDLRAPLRSITSFSQIVFDDAGDALTTENKENLTRVINAGKRMAELIDDILQLSRITREELTITTVNLSKIAEIIKHQINNSHPERKVRCDIQPDMFARADSRLLERAIENLLNNAWKYTSYTDNAEISFGTTEKHGETVYFIRDNGAGFDMSYAHKLFATFQRLHNPREFTGSGIGLAIVLRVIQRHHGRVWGEGEEGKGATFYFTLPGE